MELKQSFCIKALVIVGTLKIFILNVIKKVLLSLYSRLRKIEFVVVSQPSNGIQKVATAMIQRLSYSV